MEKVLQVLNDLERKGLIARYALGGATAAMFYSEPILTYDMDVFVFLHPPQGRIISMAPLYDHLRGKGYKEKGEHVLIEGIPVQLIPAYNALVAEALEQAKQVPYKKVKTRVLKLEHLVAIMLQTGRSKDHQRLIQLLKQVKINRQALRRILGRHGLVKKWEETLKKIGG